jgi:hypothetical protein
MTKKSAVYLKGESRRSAQSGTDYNDPYRYMNVKVYWKARRGDNRRQGEGKANEKSQEQWQDTLVEHVSRKDDQGDGKV